MKETLKSDLNISENILDILVPYGSRLAVKPDDMPKFTSFGLEIPGTVKDKPYTGTVVIPGSRCKEAKKGMHVAYSRHAGTELNINGQIFVLMREVDLILDMDTNKPFFDRVLIEQDDAPKMTESGLYIPENAQEQPQSGLVVSVGNACEEITAGLRVLFGKYAGQQIIIQGKQYLIVREPDVIGKLLMEENKGHGVVTVGYGSPEQREIKVVDYVRSLYVDNRFASVMKLEDGTYAISIENLQSSGRNPLNTMRLSEESFAALISNCLLYLNVKEIDVDDWLKKSAKGGNIEYIVSDNLKPLQ